MGLQQQKHEAEKKEGSAARETDLEDRAADKTARKVAKNEQWQRKSSIAVDKKWQQVTAETRAVTKVNGVQNPTELLAVTLTTVCDINVGNGAVKTPKFQPPIALTPQLAPSSPA